MNRFLIGAVLAGLCCAQGQNGARPKFEVASVKPCSADDIRVTVTPGSVNLPCMTPANLIHWAYVIYYGGTQHLLGGRVVPLENAPSWTETERYAIQAKAAGAPPSEMMLGPMLQALLEDRFQLRIRTDVREVPVYNLLVGKNPQKFKPAEPGACRTLNFASPQPPSPGQPMIPFCKLARITPTEFAVYGATMADLAVQLSLGLRRDVIDKTAIQGTFDFRAQVREVAGMLAPPPPPPPGAPAAPPPGSPAERVDPADIFDSTNTILDKLGLRVESAKGPGKFLVIEHIERPSAN